MITITKQNDGVLFTFQDSDKYLYGNGSILVPFNTLSIVADESDMITLRKSASHDIFLSARYDTDLGYRSKDDAIEDLKDLLFAESGITSGEVQTMIDESISGKADTSDVTALENEVATKADTSALTAVANDVQTVSGQVQTKVAITDFNAYSAATDARIAEDEEVTAAALNDLDENKQGKLVYYEENTEDGFADIYITNDDGQGNVDDYSLNVGGGTVDLGKYNQYDYGQGNSGFTSTSIMLNNPEINLISESEENGETDSTTLTVYPTGVTINDETVATESYVDAAISGKADTSAVTAAIDAATSGKVDTSAITTAITSGSTDAQVPSAKAVYDATQSGGGGMDDDTQQLISTAFNDLNDRKADLTELSKYQIKGNYVLTSTLSDYMTNASFDEYATAKEKIISGALNDLNDKFGGLRLVKISQTDYDNLATKDENTLYIINNVI